jgi:NADP-dependent 3-hydroxy acid dehydrogenase YdfG
MATRNMDAKTKIISGGEENMAILSEKRAWITGASSGIGAATAKALATNGAVVILSARREDRLKELAQEINHAGGKALIKAVDVANRKAMEKLADELEGIGGVDILINNAGLMPLSPFLEGRVDEWEQTIDVNIKGVLYAIHAVFPGMTRRRNGHIVNIGSVCGRFAYKGGAVYCGTKFAVRAISDALRREAIEYGIRMTDIEPGAVATELPDSIKHEATKKIAIEFFYSSNANILQAEDIANAIVYVVSQPNHVNVSELLIRPQTQEF